MPSRAGSAVHDPLAQSAHRLCAHRGAGVLGLLDVGVRMASVS